MNENALLKLEDTWNCITADEGSEDEYVRECFEATQLNPLSKVCGLIQQGLIPSPENLKALADDYETYLQAKGAISLEQAFFSTPKNRPGLYARESRQEFIDLIMELEKQEEISYASTAEKLTDILGYQFDPESLKKSYDRRKKSTT